METTTAIEVELPISTDPDTDLRLPANTPDTDSQVVLSPVGILLLGDPDLGCYSSPIFSQNAPEDSVPDLSLDAQHQPMPDLSLDAQHQPMSAVSPQRSINIYDIPTHPDCSGQVREPNRLNFSDPAAELGY